MRHVGGVRFGRGRQIKASLDDADLALGRTEEVVHLLGGKALQQRVGIGHADILDRRASETTKQVKRLLAGDEHPREIIKGSLGVGAADRFVKRGDEIVMALAVLVINGDPAMEQLG